ncbi:MAG TPA: gluconokinase [Rhodanobacteraceae bacterium]|nr:gluconokinase [Rhodanobacteraceae bacterium]
MLQSVCTSHPWLSGNSVLLVVMGVSGCGKSSVGKCVANRLGWSFLEGDTMHPVANVAKMHVGQPLDDADRRPWLDAIGRWMDARQAAGESAVIACSALKRRYRDRLRRGRPGVCFAWLKTSRAELERRLDRRTNHFMPSSLLDSQLATLEPPAPDEPALTIDANGDLDATVRATLAALKLH